MPVVLGGGEGVNPTADEGKRTHDLVDKAELAGELVPGGSVLGFVRSADDIFRLDSDHFLRDLRRFPLSNRSRPVMLKLVFDSLRALRGLNHEDLSGLAAYELRHGRGL